MIPQRLSLKNFLSYRQAQLDFNGLRVACVCGPNGAGKSSLLEAIAWAVWGHSRAASEDDIVHQGETEAQVDFVFAHRQQTYRVIRSRYRQQGSALEFQVQAEGDPAGGREGGWRSLTQRGMRATQQLILHHLQVDYETFVQSAYLRQGGGDEFMLKRPAERKQILADLLRLSQYDTLAERAKDRAREFKALAQAAAAELEQLGAQLAHRSDVVARQQHAQAEAAALRHQQTEGKARLANRQQYQRQRLQTVQQQQALAQQLELLWQQVTQQRQVQATLAAQLDQYQAILADKSAVLADYSQYQQLQAQEEDYGRRSHLHQQLQAQLVDLERQQTRALAPLLDQQQQQQRRLDVLTDQCQDLQHTLEARPEVAAAIVQLAGAKAELAELDRHQLARSPLVRQQQTVQQQIQQAAAHLSARLDEVVHAQQRLTVAHQQQPQMQQAVADLSHQLSYLQQRQAYREQLRLKGQERRSFMERLQATQRGYEIQLAQLDQKIQLLSQPQARCPTCCRPLDEHDSQVRGDQILAAHRQERDQVQTEIWVIREQLAVSEREIQVLRQEYRDLEAELQPYDQALEQRGQLQAQLQAAVTSAEQLQLLAQERAQLERCLAGKAYAPELQATAQALEQQLAQLTYDERDHALARNRVEKLRWAELRQAELNRAQKRLDHLQRQRPGLEAKLGLLAEQMTQIEADFAQQRAAAQQQLSELAYCANTHRQLRQQLHKLQPDRYFLLQQAMAQQPQLSEQLQNSAAQLRQTRIDRAAIALEFAVTTQWLMSWPDAAPEIAAIEAQVSAAQTRKETCLAQLGRLEQQLAQLDTNQERFDQQQQQQQTYRHQQQVYQTLALAYGKNGLQALMIENLLPQLEAETNHLLGRLSGHQLHVQFVTQRAGRSRGKLIDTLDILIADARGTRPYETYSGGEAFRVNFAVRLALAKLLAQRSGLALQLLIIDEGFGTQDRAGCDRLVAAINAIAPEFACILAVTHVPHFREAFQTRIEVVKTEQGSQLTVLD